MNAAKSSRLRQRLWRDYRALARSLRLMTSDQPLVPGSCYLMRRKCGKPNCRCARGELHPVWVLTRSEAGHHKLYVVPASQRARIRRLAAAWRRSQRARAGFVKQGASLLALADELVGHHIVLWPSDKEPTA